MPLGISAKILVVITSMGTANLEREVPSISAQLPCLPIKVQLDEDLDQFGQGGWGILLSCSAISACSLSGTTVRCTGSCLRSTVKTLICFCFGFVAVVVYRQVRVDTHFSDLASLRIV